MKPGILILKTLSGNDGSGDTTLIRRNTGLTESQVHAAVRRLLAAKLVYRPEPGVLALTDSGHYTARLGKFRRQRTASQGCKPRPTRRHSLRAKVWRSIRNQQKFSVGDVLGRICTDNPSTMRGAVLAVIRQLESAGYVVPMARRTGADGKAEARWMMMRNTGFEAPVWRPKTRELYDPNTEEVFQIVREAA
ncbi:hypothetical protein [Craterilacuibacter sinensis]|uniref:Uncharacterized protein n=1 Tax=Craterilacuibacter sinensis TaxID=2686017 RepID=A0A845BKK3_9NEIS|nr:hypothetical protein [Craterilacuibacter sinensis]MXR36739.1 hypothetical protein [Craterilacuibacter sinensis]